MVYCASAKKGSVRGRRKRSTGGVHTVPCYWGRTNCPRVLRKKARIGALGVLWRRKLQDNLLSCDYSGWQAAPINQTSQLF